MLTLWLTVILGVVLQVMSLLGNPPRQLDTPMLCVFAYQDINRNNINDNEPPLADVELFLNDTAGNTVATLVTADTPRCFTNTTPGNYQLWIQDGNYRIMSPLMQPVTLGDEPIIIELAGFAPNTPFANEICVLVFEDINQDGIHDADEGLIDNIDVWLLSDDIVIASKLTNANESTCFVGLEEGAYRVKLPSTSRHRMTTRSDAAPTFVGTGNRYSVPFGAVLLDPFNEDALLPGANPNTGKLDLDHETRLLLAIMGSGIVILLMIGVGSVAFALWRR